MLSFSSFIIREKKIISQFEDNLCDCDAFGKGDEEIHSTTCNYTKLMREINSSIGYEVEGLIEDLKDVTNAKEIKVGKFNVGFI